MISNSEYNQFKTIINDNNNPRTFITIDGVIGAGKTTLIRLLIDKYASNGITAHPIYEPVDAWMETGVLDYFYRDIKKNSYEFQTYTFITRIERVIREVLENPTADVYLLERSIHTDRNIFVELLKEDLGELRYKMYQDWWHLHQHLLPININKWIILDTSLDTSIQRICTRNRSEEAGISVDYQNNLMKKHHEFIEKLRANNENVIVIESGLMDENFIENANVLHNIYSLITE